MLLRPTQLLRGNRSYRVRVTDLRDEFANAQTAPAELEFQTAALPELRAFTVLSQPTLNAPPPYPSNLQLRWTFSRPAGLAFPVVASGRPLTIRLSPDGLSLEAPGTEPGEYTGQVALYDRVEFRRQGLDYNLTLANEPDNAPPAILYTIPAETGELPANARPRVVFSEPVALLEQPALTRDGVPVPLDTTVGLESVAVTPRTPLETGAFYRFRVPAVRDRAGNLLPGREIAFQAGPALTGPPTLVRSTPEASAQDVDRDQPLILEFNRPIDPASIGIISISAASLAFNALGASPKQWTVNGNTATFKPEPRWPRAALVNWAVNRMADEIASAARTVLPVESTLGQSTWRRKFDVK